MPDLQLSRMISPITCLDFRTDCKVHIGLTSLESYATSFEQYMNCSSWFVRYNTIYIFYVSEYSTDISKYGNYPLVCPIEKWKDLKYQTLWCVTMIDPATSWFEMKQIKNKTAFEVATAVEQTWLTRYPWPRTLTYDRGTEFMAEFSRMIKMTMGSREDPPHLKTHKQMLY